MKNIKVSIIVPVYNVEKYLRQCLNSIINQTLKEIEIICINDGSTDNSSQILEEYEKKDKRIKIVNKRNEGLGAARKTGLNYATGEFIAFVDSDDWVKLDTYEKLYNNALSNNSDIVMLNLSRYDEFKKDYSYWDGYNIAAYFEDDVDFNNFAFNYNDIKPHLLNRNFSACGKMYKSKFLGQYDDFYFPKYISYEDVPFHVQILLRATRISFCTDKLYIYRVSNTTSISNSSNKSKKVFDIFIIVDKVEDILIESKKMDEFKYEFLTFKILQLNKWFDKCDNSLKTEFFEHMKKEFEKINLNGDDLNKISKEAKSKYQNFINYRSYNEMQLLKEIKQLKSENNKLKNFYEKEINIKELTIQKITSSNSWNLTKPIRKIGLWIRSLKNI